MRPPDNAEGKSAVNASPAGGWRCAGNSQGRPHPAERVQNRAESKTSSERGARTRNPSLTVYKEPGLGLLVPDCCWPRRRVGPRGERL